VTFLTTAAAARSQSRTVALALHLNERAGPMEIDRISLGQGGLSAEPMWADRVAEIRALKPRLIRLFIQEYFDLLPAPHRYHWQTLDESVDLIEKTGARPLMTIAFKPRALFPAIDQKMVEPSNWDEWEDLVSSMARHYRERGSEIRYWEIANEPDIGEDGGCPYLFTPESYTRYYQHTAAAILRADPEARVGGPALANSASPILPALLSFSEAHHVPLHFVSWHIYNSDPQRIRATIDRVNELLRDHPTLTAETFLDEWNMSLSDPPTDPRFQPCFIAEAAYQMKTAGLDYSCYYHIRDYHVNRERFAKFMSPSGTALMTRWWNRTPQFDGLFDFENRVRPSYFAFKLLSRLTGERLRFASDDAAVHGFATHDAGLGIYNVLVWNFSKAPAEVELAVDGAETDLTARLVVLDAAAPGDDENIRLKPQPPRELKRGSMRIRVSLDSYGISFLTLEKGR
jgi:xylan 1,4-beta-xylosidase